MNFWIYNIIFVRESIFEVCIFILFLLSFILIMRIQKLKNKIQLNQTNFDLAIASAHLLILKIDENGRIINFNHNFADLFQFTYNNYNNSLIELMPDAHKDNFFKLLETVREGQNINNFEMTLINKNKKVYHILWTSDDNSDNSDEIQLIGFDITERVELEQQLILSNKDLKGSKDELLKQNLMLEENQMRIWNLAYIDNLTKLYNRVYFVEQCNKILPEENAKGVLITVDIDNIGYCNNIFGPTRTDEIIIDIATRIYKMTRKNQLVGKIGSDEFGILLTNLSDDDIQEYIEELIEVNTYNFTYDGVTLHISVSAGVSFFPDNGRDYDSLLKASSMALKFAKNNGKGQYAIYNGTMEKRLLDKMAVETLLREGLENEKFFLVYQPQYNIKNGEISGFEALLRLRDNYGTVIMPDTFIKIAEESRMIIPIGYWVIHQSCEFITRLQDKGINNLTISINVSVIQFMQDDFVYNIKNILKKYNINSKLFEIEITETSLMNLNQGNLEKINELRRFGINIALDDFGTGYSSLLYFKKTTNISVLKIDREFVKDITLNDNNIEIVDAIIYLAHKFNFTVIAEGVETADQYKILYKLGCDIMQGFLGSRPVPENVIYETFPDLSKMLHKIN